MAKIAVIDCQVAGISGDMLMSSLVDAGANAKKVIDSVFACENFLSGSKIQKVSFDKVVVHGFSATRLAMSYKDSVHERHGTDLLHALTGCCDSLDLEQRAKTFALESLKTIISAEAQIHGEDFDHVHLHEASSIDTLADIIGCSTALQDLELFDSQVYCTKVAVGAGLLNFSHGTVPNPAGAILNIFKKRKFMISGGQAQEELTTPTGAALLVNLASGSINYYPDIIPEKTGYGAGQKEFKNFANVTRILIGESALAAEKDSVCVVETNVDDVSGEIIGNLIETLADSGAKDVTVLAGIGKKNRPTHLIRVVSDNASLANILSILFAETGTLGVRIQNVERLVMPRTILTVPVAIAGSNFYVQIKAVKNADKIISFKPEFEDVRKIAQKSKMPTKRVMDLVLSQVAEKMGGMT
ncbi:MAG: nickel pincer cofactor biosynthesis protein LarC [Nitrososphaera sp.]|nr:nickel pincer cofactor biosynthesis protein LarC [Nitrososphaera sp.]